MRKIVAAALVAVSALGLGSALADPGPNGHNDYGLCQAYFSGSANGQDHKHNAGPFVALEKAADDGNDQTSPEEDVAKFCESVTPGGK